MFCTLRKLKQQDSGICHSLGEKKMVERKNKLQPVLKTVNFSLSRSFFWKI